MALISIYCSGSIVKGASDEKKLCWGDTERGAVAKGAAPHEMVFLNPDDPITDPGNTLGQFGRDMFQIFVATAVVVDARERRGLGIGVEMAAAAAMGVPVVVVTPRNSKYRQDTLEYRGVTVTEYVHPHVAALAWRVVDDFEAAGTALQELASHEVPDRRKSVPAWLTPAIEEYENNLLGQDPPMVQAMAMLGQR